MADPVSRKTADILPNAVGAMVIHFALLEHWIDGMIATIFYHVEGARSIRTRYPFNAKDEIRIR